MHRSRVLLWILLSFLVGTVIGSYWPLKEKTVWWAAGIAAGIIAVSAYHRVFGQTEKGIQRRKLGVLIGCCLLVAAYGLYHYQQFDADRSHLTEFNDRLVKGEGVPVIVHGYVAGDVQQRGDRTEVPVLVKEIFVPGRKVFANEKALVLLRSSEPYRYGDRVAFNGSPEAPKNTGEFDYVMYLKKQGIRSILEFPEAVTVRQSYEIGRFESFSIRVQRVLQTIRRSFERSLEQSMPEPSAAFVKGILLGSRGDIPADLRDAFARTSTSHVLAISGYNIAIVIGMVMAVVLYWFKRGTAFWIAVAVVALFTLLTGASASVVRAAIMGTVLLVASGIGRLYNPLRAILLAAAVMVWFNPFVLLFDVGFQLSFVAVLGLAYLYPILEQRVSKRWLRGTIRETLLMTIAAQVMVLPLIIGYFHTLSLLSVLVNLLILPIIPLVMLFGFITGIVGLVFPLLGEVVGFLTLGLASYVINIVAWFAAIPFAAVSVQLPWAVIIFLYVLIGAALIHYYRNHELV